MLKGNLRHFYDFKEEKRTNKKRSVKQILLEGNRRMGITVGNDERDSP